MTEHCKHERVVLWINDPGEKKYYYLCMKNQDFNDFRCVEGRHDCFESKQRSLEDFK